MAYSNRDSLRSNPANAPRDTTTSSSDGNGELSTVDKTWGLLFDEGSPTERFGQFTRGIANHIREVYVPEKTLAIPPGKMARFYAAYGLYNERFPLTKIFQLPYEEISWIYRYLECEFYLVPEGDLTKEPAIPALTPFGFNRWMTLFVLAYPSEESERLQKVVETMPVDADGVLVERKPERLPKQLSRHLLPPKRSRESRELLEYALPDFKDLDISSQKSSKLPLVNSMTPCYPTKHHEDPYSKECATSEDHSAKFNLQPNMSDKRHVRFQRNGRNGNSTQRRKGNVYVHNTKYNNN